MHRMAAFLVLSFLTGVPLQAAKPRLVVLISVDQYRADYLTRFWELYLPARSEGDPGGFRFLAEEGADFRSAEFGFYSTFTCPGHASIVTGTVPAVHGVIANKWFVREKKVLLNPCTAGLEGAPSGPHSLRANALGDELKLSSGGGAKVVSMAVKDYVAILMGGRLGTALWMDWSQGLWQTSDYYGELPAWALELNAGKPLDRFRGQRWEPVVPTPEASRFLPSKGAQDAGFSHEYPDPAASGYRDFVYAPAGNEFVMGGARQAVARGGLGADRVTDLLLVGLSSNDYVGHRYGPYSPEVLDITVRTDRLLAAFFSFLDEQVGLENVLIALTADHGVSPVPERFREMGIDSQRVAYEEFLGHIDAALDQRFGPADWTWAFNSSEVYLNLEAIDEKGLSREEAFQAAAQAAMSRDEVHSAYTHRQVAEGRVPPNDLGRKLANGFHVKRAGDVIVLFEPHHFPVTEFLSTTHGTPHAYDTRVPILLYGSGVRPGTYYRKVDPIDIAPTLSHLLGIAYPSAATGEPLHEAIR